ncbi:hypothetical protein KI688_000601 [Linnemannia hyalina]|uniref:Uncharacterized protein n=1 Tax=Linnemannia hyalina TaxID=64524 RepID=A0A9P7Y6F7_9FUNG|nr:hypothetical protein KI688_000601 [Linnemannia hyalina]
MVVQKQRRPRLILLLATALLLQGVLAAHKNNSPSSSFSSSLASSSNTITANNNNNNNNNNLDIDESFQLKAKKEHKKIAGVDLDAAAEAIEKAVGPRAMAAAKKKADKFLADHKKKKGDKKDKSDDKKKKKAAVAAKKNKGDDEEEEEEDIAISSTNNEEEEENDIPMNIEDVQDYLSDMWEDIKDLGNDAAIQDQLQSLKESDGIQAQIAQLQSLGDDNPEILDRIEKLREGLDPEVREGIGRVEEGVRKAAKQLGKRHVWHQKDVQRHEGRLEDSEATGEDGFETDVSDAGDEAEMKSQAAAKKNRKHQHQKGGLHEEAEAVGGGQKNKKHDRDFNKPTKQHRHGKHGQRGAKKGGTRKTKNNGKGKKHLRVAKKYAVRRKGKGGTIRDGHPGTPPVVVPEPVAVPTSASAPVKNNGRRPDGHRHRHHHHRKQRGGNHKGRQHPRASNGSGLGATLPGDETKGPNPPVHTVPTPPSITLPIEVPLKDASPTESTVPKPQEPPSSPAPETPKEPVVDDTTFPLVDTPTPPSKPITKAENPAETIVQTVFPTEQPPQQQQPEAPKDEEKQQNKDREVQQLPPKPEEISPPAPVQEKQQPGDIVVVTSEPDLQEKHHHQPAYVKDLQRLPYPVDHQLPRVPGTSNNGDAQTPMAAPVLEPEQKEVPKVKEPAPASQPPGTAPKSSDSVPASEPFHESDPAEVVAAPSSPIAIPDLPTTPPRTPASANDKKPLEEDDGEDGEDDKVEDHKDGGEWGEDDDEDEEVGGGAAVKTEKDAAAAGVGVGLHKRQILAIRVFGVKGGVVDNKAAAAKNDPQQQQQQRREKEGSKVEKEDKKAQRQESTGAAVEPIAKAEETKKDKAQVVEANMAKDGDNKHVKDDNHQQQQQRQKDQQKKKEVVVEAQADKKQQQRKEVEQRKEDDDDFVEKEKADIRNEDDITNPRPAKNNDGAANFEYDGGQKGKKNKKNKKGREKKKNRQDDNENVGQGQNNIVDVTVNKDQNAAAAVNPFEVGATKVKKAHKKHKNHHNQDQIPNTFQADPLPAAVDPFAIKNNGGAVYKKGTKAKDTDVQQQQDDKSKNEKPNSAPPSNNNNNNKDPKAIAGTPSVPMSSEGPADREAPNSPANSGPAGVGPITPPKEGKDATAIGGGGNGYGTVPMFGPAQLDLGSGGVASSRLMIGGQWVASLSVAVLATVFMYL